MVTYTETKLGSENSETTGYHVPPDVIEYEVHSISPRGVFAKNITFTLKSSLQKIQRIREQAN